MAVYYYYLELRRPFTLVVSGNPVGPASRRNANKVWLSNIGGIHPSKRSGRTTTCSIR